MTPTEKQLILITLIAALPGLLTATVALWVAIKKNPHEAAKTDADTQKIKAETDDLHSQIADRWAEHVEDLMRKVDLLQAARELDQQKIEQLSLDINQVRRENESYRIELKERDEIIDALKDWGERLNKQVLTYAPHIIPEKYYRRRSDA